jgi:hypothetical protein
LLVDSEELDATIARERARNKTVGAVTMDRTADATFVERMGNDAATYARMLFAVLHEMDERGCDVIIVESVPRSPEWLGVRDRLARAAHR